MIRSGEQGARLRRRGTGHGPCCQRVLPGGRVFDRRVAECGRSERMAIRNPRGERSEGRECMARLLS